MKKKIVKFNPIAKHMPTFNKPKVIPNKKRKLLEEINKKGE